MPTPEFMLGPMPSPMRSARFGGPAQNGSSAVEAYMDAAVDVDVELYAELEVEAFEISGLLEPGVTLDMGGGELLRTA
jgi:hypothetical protein